MFGPHLLRCFLFNAYYISILIAASLEAVFFFLVNGEDEYAGVPLVISKIS